MVTRAVDVLTPSGVKCLAINMELLTSSRANSFECPNFSTSYYEPEPVLNWTPSI
jgi:hypothetical protein